MKSIEEMKKRLESVRAELAYERRQLPYADGGAWHQARNRINELEVEEFSLARKIAAAEKDGVR